MLFITGIFPTIVIAENNSPSKGKNKSQNDSIIVNDGINKLDAYTYTQGGFFEFQIGIQYRVWINHTNTIQLVDMNSSNYGDIYAFFLNIFGEKRKFAIQNIAKAIIDDYPYNFERIGAVDRGFGVFLEINRPLIKKTKPPYYPYLWQCSNQEDNRSLLVY